MEIIALGVLSKNFSNCWSCKENICLEGSPLKYKNFLITI